MDTDFHPADPQDRKEGDCAKKTKHAPVIIGKMCLLVATVLF